MSACLPLKVLVSENVTLAQESSETEKGPGRERHSTCAVGLQTGGMTFDYSVPRLLLPRRSFDVCSTVTWTKEEKRRKEQDNSSSPGSAVG